MNTPLPRLLAVLVALCSAGDLHADLIAHYTFEGASDLNADGLEDAIDEAGNLNDAIAAGDTLPAPDEGVGPAGDAFRFGGFGNLVVPLEINPSQFPDLTVTMWVKLDEGVPPGLY